MATKKLWKAPGLVPVLSYEDMPAAVEWLARVDLDASAWELPPGVKRGGES